ncbi:MAG: hypothetical protein ACQEQM_09335 [Thermoplasmatota archaeon]
MKELHERYMKIYEDSEDIIEDLKKEFTKEEMKEIFEDLNFDFKDSQTKDVIAERMQDVKFYEAVKEQEGEITIKVSKGKEEKKEKLISTLNILENLIQEESQNIQKFWKGLKKEADKGLKDIKSTHKKHWDDIEDKWGIKSDRFQKELDETGIPKEELEELEQRWGKLLKEMNSGLKDIRGEMKMKREDIKEIIYEYIGDSQRIIQDEKKDMRDLYPLWFDMIKDIRDEVEKSKDVLKVEEAELLETWEELSTKIRKEVKDLADEHQEEADELFKIWISISEDMEKMLDQIPDKYYDMYSDFWKKTRIKRPDIKEKIMSLSDEYSELMKDPLKSIRSTYKKILGPSKDEIEELKERIAELEEKLEEKD